MREKRLAGCPISSSRPLASSPGFSPLFSAWREKHMLLLLPFCLAEVNHLLKIICSRYDNEHMSESENTSQKKNLKRDSSFLDDDCGLLLHSKCKIPKRSAEDDYNEMSISKDESPPRCKLPEMSAKEHYNEEPIFKDEPDLFTIYIGSDEEYKDLTQLLMEKMTMESVSSTNSSLVGSCSVIDISDASIYSKSITSSMSGDSSNSKHKTHHPQRKSYYHTSELEDFAAMYDEDDASSIYKGNFDTLPSQKEIYFHEFFVYDEE